MKEAQKAETKIRRMRRTAEKAVEAANLKWNNKVDGYIASLPVDVRAVLRAGGVLSIGEGDAPEEV
jgi:hypothetical protein